MTFRGFDAREISGLAEDLRGRGERARTLHRRLAEVLTAAEMRLEGRPATTDPHLERLVGWSEDAWFLELPTVSADPSTLPGSLQGELTETADELERRVAQLEGCQELADAGYAVDDANMFADEAPPDAADIDAALSALAGLESEEIAPGGTREELREIKGMLDGLTAAQLDALIARAPMEDLRRYNDLISSDVEIFGVENGLPDQERQEHLGGLLRRVGSAQLEKLREAFPGVEPSADSSAVDRGEFSHWGVPPDVPLFCENGSGAMVSGDDVSQGRLGDCWFLASLAAVAERNPEFIEQGIRENANGTLDVRIWDPSGRERWVTVTRSLPMWEDGELLSAGGGGELWPAYYEKAFAQVYGEDEAGLPPGSYRAIEGDHEQQSPPYVTGEESELLGDPWGLTTYEAVREAWEAGRPIIVDSPSEADEEPPGWQGSYARHHVYYVEGFDENGSILLGNPWGPEHDLRVTPEQFEEYFETPRALRVPQ